MVANRTIWKLPRAWPGEVTVAWAMVVMNPVRQMRTERGVRVVMQGTL